MANKIYKHISKAFKKRAVPKEAPSTGQDDEAVQDEHEELEQRLDEIIQNIEPPKVKIPKTIIIDNNIIAKEYLIHFNNFIDKNPAVDDSMLDNYHHLAIQELFNEYLGDEENNEIKQQIEEICENEKNKQLNIKLICANIEAQRNFFINFQEKIKPLPTSFEKEKLNSFFDVKINNPNYKLIQEIYKKTLAQNKYIENDEELIKLTMLYAKTLVLLTNFEYGLLSSLAIKYPELSNPFSSAEFETLNRELDSYLVNCSSGSLDKLIRIIRHSITYNIELISRGMKNEFLSQVNIEKYRQKSIQKLIDSPDLWSAVQNLDSFDERNIDIVKLSEANNNLSLYQQYLNEFGKLKINLTIVKSDFTVIQQIQSLHHEILQLSTSFKIIKSLKSVLADASGELHKIKAALVSLSKLLLTIKHTIEESDVDEYGIQTIVLFRITRGDFFNLKDRDNLVSATFDIHSVSHPIKLFNDLIDNFKQYSPEKQFECLLFVKNYLLLDTNNSLINVKYDKSEFIDKVDMFCNYVSSYIQDNPHADEVVQEISEILVQKIVDKTNDFSKKMDAITKGDIPCSELLIRVNTIAHDIPLQINNIPLIEEYLLETNFIIEAPNFLSNSDKMYNEKMFLAIGNLCTLLATRSEYQSLASSLSEKLSEVLTRANTETKEISIEEISNTQHYPLSKSLFEIIAGTSNLIENEKSLVALVEAVESGFVYHFCNINLAEMKNLIWTQDEQRMKEGLIPFAPNIRKYYQYFNMVTQYFGLVILTQIEKEEGEIRPRDSLHEVKKIREFIEKATMRAIDNGAMATAMALNTTLNIPAIKRLGLGSDENEALRNKKIDNIIASAQSPRSTIVEQNGLPFLGSILDHLAKTYQRKAGSEFEKRVLIGKKLQLIEGKKHVLKENTVIYDLVEQMLNLFRNTKLLLSPMLKNDILLYDERIMSIAQNASEHIKPNQYQAYDINDFHTLPGLKHQLSYWKNRMEDFHLTTKQPEDKIANLIVSLASNDEALEHAHEAFGILQLVEDINKANGRTYKNHEHDLNKILAVYYKNLNTHLKDDFIGYDEAVSNFFAIFHDNPKLKSFLANESDSLNPFSAHHNLKTTIDQIVLAEKKYNKSLELANETQGQQAYSQLLIKILEGDSQAPVLQIGSTQQTKFTAAKTLLPESEFPVPQAEPEHPDYIGINRTMNFNPDAKYRSTLELFAASELKKDFLKAFPWGLDVNSVQNLENAKYSPELNLIAIEHVIDPHLQLTLMNYILLSLDCLGKLSGPMGELSITNFSRIKNISDTLQEVATLLTFAEIDHEVLTTKIDHMTYKLVLLNNDLTDMLEQHNPPFPVLENLPMNDFCHINEYLCHKLLGIPYQKSILTPMSPYSSVLELISPKLKDDLLRHSGINDAVLAKLSRQRKEIDVSEGNEAKE